MNTNFNKGYLCDEASQDICFSMLHICIMLEFYFVNRYTIKINIF